MFKVRMLVTPWDNISARGGYRSHPREMIAEIRDNGQLDWSHFFVVQEGNDVTPPLSNCRLDSTRLSAAKILRGPEDGWGCSEMTRAGYYGQPSGNSERTQSGGSHCRSR